MSATLSASLIRLESASRCSPVPREASAGKWGSAETAKLIFVSVPRARIFCSR